MYKNIFISYKNLNQIIEKQILQKEFYAKYICRKRIIHSGRVLPLILLDNDSNFLIVTSRKLFHLIKRLNKNKGHKKIIKLGLKIKISDFYFNKQLKFQYEKQVAKIKTEFYLKDYYYHLNLILVNKLALIVFLIKTWKGGYIGICQGFLGYFPRAQLIYFFKIMGDRWYKKLKKVYYIKFLYNFLLQRKDTKVLKKNLNLLYNIISFTYNSFYFFFQSYFLKHNRYKNQALLFSKKYRKNNLWKSHIRFIFIFFLKDNESTLEVPVKNMPTYRKSTKKPFYKKMKSLKTYEITKYIN